MNNTCDYQCVKNESMSLEEVKESLRMTGLVGEGVVSCGKYPNRIVEKMCDECVTKNAIEQRGSLNNA